MTLHIHYNHQCAQCGAYYIPYGNDVPCPRCGIMEQERYNFIPQAVESAYYNLKSQHSYTPMAWYVGSLGDHILYLMFPILEQHRLSPTQSFNEVAWNMVQKMNFGEQEYLRDHLYSILILVYQQLQGMESSSLEKDFSI